MTYTAKEVEVTTGLMPKFRKTTHQYHVLFNGEYYGRAESLRSAQEIADHLNAREADYQKQLADSGLPEWQFQDQNSAQ